MTKITIIQFIYSYPVYVYAVRSAITATAELLVPCVARLSLFKSQYLMYAESSVATGCLGLL